MPATTLLDIPPAEQARCTPYSTAHGRAIFSRSIYYCMLLEILSAVRDRSKVLCCRGTAKCAGATACLVVDASYGVAVLLAVW